MVNMGCFQKIYYKDTKTQTVSITCSKMPTFGQITVCLLTKSKQSKYVQVGFFQKPNHENDDRPGHYSRKGIKSWCSQIKLTCFYHSHSDFLSSSNLISEIRSNSQAEPLLNWPVLCCFTISSNLHRRDPFIWDQKNEQLWDVPHDLLLEY